MIKDNVIYWDNNQIHKFAKNCCHKYYDRQRYFGQEVQLKYQAYELLYHYTDSSYRTAIATNHIFHEYLNIKVLTTKSISGHDKQITQQLIKDVIRNKQLLHDRNDKAIQTNLLKMNKININNSLSSVSKYTQNDIHYYILRISKAYIKHALNPQLNHINSDLVKNGTLSKLLYIIATTIPKPTKGQSILLLQHYSKVYTLCHYNRVIDYDNILDGIISKNVYQLLNGIKSYNKDSIEFDVRTHDIKHKYTKNYQTFEYIIVLITHHKSNRPKKHIPWTAVINQIKQLPKMASKDEQKRWDKFINNQRNIKVQKQFKKDTKLLMKKFAKINHQKQN